MLRQARNRIVSETEIGKLSLHSFLSHVDFKKESLPNYGWLTASMKMLRMNILLMLSVIQLRLEKIGLQEHAADELGLFM